MRKAYPIILSPTEDGWILVSVPDFNINTQGADIADAMFMARDAIGLMGITLEDEGREPPAASDISQITKSAGQNDTISLVDVDFSAYRRQNDLRTIRKNCTVPAWLSNEAEKQGINFSALLQSALKEKLNVNSPADISK